MVYDMFYEGTGQETAVSNHVLGRFLEPTFEMRAFVCHVENRCLVQKPADAI